MLEQTLETLYHTTTAITALQRFERRQAKSKTSQLEHEMSQKKGGGEEIKSLRAHRDSAFLNKQEISLIISSL